MKKIIYSTFIFIGSLSSASAAETREYTGDTNDLQFIEALDQGDIFTVQNLESVSGNQVTVNFDPSGTNIPRAVLGAFSVNTDVTNNLVKFQAGDASPGISYIWDRINVGNVFGALSVNGNVLDNTLIIDDSSYSLAKVYGGFGVSQFGLVKNNQVIFNGGSAGQVVGGGSIFGHVIDNSVTINDGSVDDVVGGVSDFGFAIGNSVTISSAFTGEIGSLTGGRSSLGSLNNTLNIYGGEFSTVEGGKSLGNVSGNTVNIFDGLFGQNLGTYHIAGGYSEGGGIAFNNTVNVYNGDIYTNIYGGYGVADVFGNQVLVNTDAKTINGSIFGGYSQQSGFVYNNLVSIENTNTQSVYGGYSGSVLDVGGVNNNYVSIDRAVVHGEVIGGYSEVSSANTNQVDINGEGYTQVFGSVAGGYGAQADNNIVNIYWAGVIDGNIRGGVGQSTNGNIVNFFDGVTQEGEGPYIGSIIGGLATGNYSNYNYVGIHGGNINGVVYGGQSEKYASYNIVNITGGTFNDSVVAAFLNYVGGEAVGNQLYISGGVLYGDVFVASVGANSQVTGNELIISGGTILGNVYASRGREDTVYYPSNNKITLMDVLTIHGQVKDDWGANTQLIFHNFRGNIYGGIDTNFDTFEFVVSKEAENITPEEKVDLNDRSIKLHSVANDEYFQVGDVSVLLAAASNTGGTNDFLGSSIPSGATLIYDFERVDSTDSLAVRVADIRTQPQLKALSEAQLGALAFLNQNSDQLSMAARSLSHRAKNSDKKWLKFTEVSGGSSRYQTGSHVDVAGASLLTGVARRLGQSSLLGLFAEGGWGSYNTVNPMESAPDVHSDGHVNFLGGGLIARHDFKKGMYMDAALRLGQVNTQFDSADISYNAGPTSFQTKALYYGAMLGFGHRWNLGNRFVLDTSGHQMWNRQAGNQVNVAGDPKPVDLHAIESHRLRGQVRIDYQGSLLSPYLSLAYEHEFQGQAHASVNGFSVPAPSLRGGTGVGGLGVKIQRSSGKSFVHAGVQGFVGKRQGFALMMNAGLVF